MPAAYEKRHWFFDSILAGVVAALAYTTVAQCLVVGLYGSDKFFLPFRQIAAVAVGPAALSNEYSAAQATLIGTATHFAVGVCYAVIFAAIANLAGVRSKAGLVIFGALYGIVIYALNFCVIFPRWFP